MLGIDGMWYELIVLVEVEDDGTEPSMPTVEVQRVLTEETIELSIDVVWELTDELEDMSSRIWCWNMVPFSPVAATIWFGDSGLVPSFTAGIGEVGIPRLSQSVTA